ncbi:hypothetical protein ACFQ0K_06090 [Nocardioides caeni]|uniref:Uncharacterized protein n=1 Tax=Nocardioides caeni TaxID=574700 RepID=A0A4S8NA75_9ACTN|nr:hypothetical protein [Nocardioides caeni]THV12985.1 hypothetical protein E9934_11485 [Nocardioides caeni]
MPIARSTLAGISTGIVLLAGAAGFGIGLPKVIDEPDAVAAGEVPTLPDRLDDRMISLSALTPENTGVSTAELVTAISEGAINSVESDDETTAALADIYGAASVRTYIDAAALGQTMETQDGSIATGQLVVTVIPDGGLAALPRGPYVVDSSGVKYEPTEIDGHPCAVSEIYVDQQTGQPIEGDIPAINYSVECRGQSNGLGYVVSSAAMLPEEVAAYLELVMEQTS